MREQDALPELLPSEDPTGDYDVVAHLRGRTSLRCRIGGRWREEAVGPGDVSLLAPDAQPRWARPADVEVVRVPLRRAALDRVAREMVGDEVAEVELREVIRTEDPAIHRTAALIGGESAQGTTGSRLMVEALSSQIAVHVVRRHVRVRLREPGGAGALTFAQERRVRDHVHRHLDASLTLDELAAVAGMSRFRFARRFRSSTGTTPHEYVLRARVGRACVLLERTRTPLFEVAVRCGFADQSHLTREFRKRTGTTPGRYRAGGR